jgi:L-alanine-DL-glutamate epimerase-like enolase superfamily enzyme
LFLEFTELVEQPLPAVAWDEMKTLAAASRVPLMLDESIQRREDAERARETGCAWIKLKLCKQGGSLELIDLAEYARHVGLDVILGNGVATDIVNVLELDVCRRRPDLFRRASESNGFAKLRAPVRYTSLGMKAGCAAFSC